MASEAGSGKDLYTVTLQISTNLVPQEPIEIGKWKFIKQFVDNRDVLLGTTEIEAEEYKGFMPKVGSHALDSVEQPLTGLAFCLDGVFRVNPNLMEVSSSKIRLPNVVFYEDWRHARFGRAFTKEDCKYIGNITETMKNDELLTQLLRYYRLGLSLSHGYYYLSEAFLNFYKIIETLSWVICDKYQPELKARKGKELDNIAERILNERRLDDLRHSRKTKINRVKNLIDGYIFQKEITAKDQVEFTCVKLGLADDVQTAKGLVEIRNQGGIAHSSKGQAGYQWLEELRQCRNIARKSILKYLISEGVLEPESYSELMRVPSGIH